MTLEYKKFESGVVCLFTNENPDADISAELAAFVDQGEFGFAIVYFSKASHAPDAIISIMENAAPGLRYAACSTAGEITPQGLVLGELLVLLFPKQVFQICSCEIAGNDEADMENTIARINSLRNEFETSGLDGGEIFAICLMDGMSYMEEAITATIHWGLQEIPLLGGSAGDDMNFSETSLILDGRQVEAKAVLLMISTTIPFKIFKTENFVARSEKLVVTASDPDKRIVHELNGAPAAQVYADVINVDPNALTPQSFASHPLVVRVGGEYFCRSIQKVNPDNSLTFFCAIDDGVVLTVAEPTGMARSTQDTMEQLCQSLGEVDFILGFDCVLRRIDAHNRQVTHKISEIYRRNSVVGFNTYGEQYRSMHLNQTLTGVAFGKSGEMENVKA